MALVVTYASVTVAARRTLLDALGALAAQRDGLVLVGAQAVYLYTGDADVAIDTQTKDSDLVVVPSRLADVPLLEQAMAAGGFQQDRASQQPGEWSAGAGEPPVELLVPEALSGRGGRRGARIPPHSKHAARVVPGLEAAAVSFRPMQLASLAPDRDDRTVVVNVATPAALLVAKAYKIGERHRDEPGRLLDKDAHDIYRLLRAVRAKEVLGDLDLLVTDDLAGPVTRQALRWLDELTPAEDGPIPLMAGRAERLAGDPADVAQSTWALVREIVDAPGA